jgi:hypothetical protein
MTQLLLASTAALATIALASPALAVASLTTHPTCASDGGDTAIWMICPGQTENGTTMFWPSAAQPAGEGYVPALNNCQQQAKADSCTGTGSGSGTNPPGSNPNPPVLPVTSCFTKDSFWESVEPNIAATTQYDDAFAQCNAFNLQVCGYTLTSTQGSCVFNSDGTTTPPGCNTVPSVQLIINCGLFTSSE